MPSFILEIATYSIESALAAEIAGAHRIELCDNPHEGGTTPSYGVPRVAKERLSIPVFPIIRPRGGHFVLTAAELDAMRYDISWCRQVGFEGVVIGLLNADSTVDYENTARLVELAYPMEVTFHRAFDRTPDPFAALDTIIKTGCTRILTSGQVPDVNKNAGLVAKLVQQANHDIIIMPGSGVRANGIADLAAVTGANEFHFSASYWQDEPYFSPASMQENLRKNKLDTSEIRDMLVKLNNYFATPCG